MFAPTTTTTEPTCLSKVNSFRYHLTFDNGDIFKLLFWECDTNPIHWGHLTSIAYCELDLVIWTLPRPSPNSTTWPGEFSSRAVPCRTGMLINMKPHLNSKEVSANHQDKVKPQRSVSLQQVMSAKWNKYNKLINQDLLFLYCHIQCIHHKYHRNYNTSCTYHWW